MQTKGFRQFERCLLFSKPLSVCHFLLFFFFCLPFRHFFHQSLLRYYCCFVSLALSLLPLSFHRFCFVPSNQFPAIPFSNPPCCHFRSFRSSILPLCTVVFSGLAFPFFLFVLVFVWFSFDCCCHLFSSLGVVFFVSLSVVFGCAIVAKVVLVSAQGFFSEPLLVCHSLLFLFFFFCHSFQHSKVFFFSWAQFLS